MTVNSPLSHIIGWLFALAFLFSVTHAVMLATTGATMSLFGWTTSTVGSLLAIYSNIAFATRMRLILFGSVGQPFSVLFATMGGSFIANGLNNNDNNFFAAGLLLVSTGAMLMAASIKFRLMLDRADYVY